MSTPSPWPVAGVTALCSLMAAVYAATDLQPAPIVTFGISVLPFLACAWWVYSDGQNRGVPFVQDWGMLAWIAWPILIPWYAYRTRGRSGWRLTAGLYAAILVPYLAAALGAGYALARAQ